MVSSFCRFLVVDATVPSRACGIERKPSLLCHSCSASVNLSSPSFIYYKPLSVFKSQCGRGSHHLPQSLTSRLPLLFHVETPRVISLGTMPHCPSCKTPFTSSQALKAHQRVSSHCYCRECDRYFLNERLKAEHPHDAHNVAFPLWCKECGTGFYAWNELESHKTRTGHLYCSPCAHCFKDEEGLKKHKQTSHIFQEDDEEARAVEAHITKLFAARKTGRPANVEYLDRLCRYCNQTFKNEELLSEHNLEHHRFQCGPCGEHFKIEDALESHKRQTGHLYCYPCKQSFPNKSVELTHNNLMRVMNKGINGHNHVTGCPSVTPQGTVKHPKASPATHNTPPPAKIQETSDLIDLDVTPQGAPTQSSVNQLASAFGTSHNPRVVDKATHAASDMSENKASNSTTLGSQAAIAEPASRPFTFTIPSALNAPTITLLQNPFNRPAVLSPTVKEPSHDDSRAHYWSSHQIPTNPFAVETAPSPRENHSYHTKSGEMFAPACVPQREDETAHGVPSVAPPSREEIERFFAKLQVSGEPASAQTRQFNAGTSNKSPDISSETRPSSIRGNYDHGTTVPQEMTPTRKALSPLAPPFQGASPFTAPDAQVIPRHFLQPNNEGPNVHPQWSTPPFQNASHLFAPRAEVTPECLFPRNKRDSPMGLQWFTPPQFQNASSTSGIRAEVAASHSLQPDNAHSNTHLQWFTPPAQSTSPAGAPPAAVPSGQATPTPFTPPNDKVPDTRPRGRAPTLKNSIYANPMKFNIFMDQQRVRRGGLNNIQEHTDQMEVDKPGKW